MILEILFQIFRFLIIEKAKLEDTSVAVLMLGKLRIRYGSNSIYMDIHHILARFLCTVLEIL